MTDLYKMAKDRKKEIVSYYGGTTSLSKKLNITPSAVSKWIVIPMRRAYEIKDFGDFELYFIRPDYVKNNLITEANSQCN